MPLNYPVYIGLAAILVIAPGPDFAVVTKNCLLYGRRSGLLTSLGVLTSQLVQGSVVAFGNAALIVRSPTAFNTLKVVGALYLVFLSFQSFRAAFISRRGGAATAPDAGGRDAVEPPTRRTLWRGYGQGFLSNITNPKVLVFYLSLLPQFVNESYPALPQVLILAVTHACLALVWRMLLVFVLERLRDVLRSPKAQRIMAGFTGIALFGFGLRLLTT